MYLKIGESQEVTENYTLKHIFFKLPKVNVMISLRMIYPFFNPPLFFPEKQKDYFLRGKQNFS